MVLAYKTNACYIPKLTTEFWAGLLFKQIPWLTNVNEIRYWDATNVKITASIGKNPKPSILLSYVITKY